MTSRSTVLLAKVLGGVTMKQSVKVALPQMKLDSYLNAYFRENDELNVHDPKEIAKPGDWILIRPLPTPISLKVKHELLKVVYIEGNRYCPLTGKKTVGVEFADEIEMESQALEWIPLEKRKD